ncbi:MAG: nitroreductase [Paraglaciecola sp.]|jgi:nitroreductase
MQMAALAQGYGGVWRTGSYAQNDYVKEAFELSEGDEIIGFLYLGTPVTKTMPKPAKLSQDFFEMW